MDAEPKTLVSIRGMLLSTGTARKLSVSKTRLGGRDICGWKKEWKIFRASFFKKMAGGGAALQCELLQKWDC
jgi:hypothetical protein